MLFTDPDPNLGTCWDPFVCPGQPKGDATCDCLVNIGDLGALKLSWFKSTGQPGYNLCADFDHSGTVNIADLGILKVHWFQNVCPP